MLSSLTRAIQLPTEISWSSMKEEWAADSGLDLQLFLDFLSEHTHQTGCLRESCKWCTVTQAVDEVRKTAGCIMWSIPYISPL